jgi:RNA polymerase sigma factor (sigma-70 family)
LHRVRLAGVFLGKTKFMEQDACPQNPPRDTSKASDFGDVVRDHAAMVRATARRVTGNAALADDVTQETFLALARRGHGALESVAAWLHRVAGRKASNALRGEERRRRQEETAAALAPGGVEGLDLKDLEPAVYQLLNELPTPWKECLVEHYLEGRTQQEVAHRRGISQSTVSRYLDAGLRELKEQLRSKGIVCGTALTVLASARSAAASSLSSACWSGSIAATGAHSSTPMTTLSPAVLVMKATQIVITAAAAATLVGIPVFLYHHRAEEPVKPTAAKPASKAPAASGFARAGKMKARGAATAPKHFRPGPVTEEVRLKVDALVQRCGNMSEQELMQDPEMQELMEDFIRLIGSAGASPPPRLEQAFTDLMAAKGANLPDLENTSGPPGIAMNFLKPGALKEPLARSWIEASMSNDPKRVQDWVLNRLEGAIFEFAIDPGLDQSSEGVSFLKPRAARKDDKEEY